MTYVGKAHLRIRASTLIHWNAGQWCPVFWFCKNLKSRFLMYNISILKYWQLIQTVWNGVKTGGMSCLCVGGSLFLDILNILQFARNGMKKQLHFQNEFWFFIIPPFVCLPSSFACLQILVYWMHLERVLYKWPT
jgi:hypothetical protein